jgi:hypothetical protein
MGVAARSGRRGVSLTLNPSYDATTLDHPGRPPGTAAQLNVECGANDTSPDELDGAAGRTCTGVRNDIPVDLRAIV